MEYGIYIPVNLTEEYTNVKTGPNNPLVEEGQNVVQRVRKLKRDLDTILQIVKWLYLVSGLDVASFINKYVSYGQTETGDSATVYDLSRVEIKLPRVDTVEKGIEIMSQSAPTLFRQNRIYLYSAKFFNGVLYYLQKYDHERKPREIVIPTVIYREDISEEDFKPQRRVAIFTNEENMRTWLDTLDKLSFRNIIIENELNISNALRLEPYLYYSPTKNIYLIQNVSGGDRRRAINVAFNWYLYKVNIGHDTPEYDQDLPVYVVYGISPALAPILIENNAGESMQYLQILSYGSNQYAAMLPLL